MPRRPAGTTPRPRGRPPKRPPGFDRPEYVPGYHYEQARADRVIRFVETFLVHAKGRWAGQPFRLMQWQKRDIIEPLFGWVDADGNRRYRTAAIFTPKKNGKSTLLSALAIYFLLADGEDGAEIVSAGCDRLQAGIIAREAMALVQKSETLSTELEVVESRNTIVYRRKHSRYYVLSGDNFRSEGINAHAVLFDELHAQRDDRLFRALRYAGAARRQPLLISISTAGFDRRPGAIWWEQWQYAERIQADPSIDPTFFGKIYAAPEQADAKSYLDPELWRTANPSLGETITEESFRADAVEAFAKPASLNSWLRYRLNVPTQADTRWFHPDAVAACMAAPPESLAGRDCWAGLDLASTRDLTAFVTVFPNSDDTIDVDARFFLPRSAAADRELRDHVPYMQWLKEGWITGTEGDICDYNAVRAFIRDYGENHRIQTIAADRWNAASTMTDLTADGFNIVGFPQNFGSLSAPSKLLETLIVGKRIRFVSPVLQWMFGNVTVVSDSNENIRPSKDKSSEKIDGIVALVMALAVQSTAQRPPDQSWDIVLI
jgi:phage terminase large subunit-like protein